jgi:hypothetical protein
VCEIFLTEDITNDMISIEGFALERKDRSEALENTKNIFSQGNASI